ADVIDTSVPDGFGQDVMTLHGTVEEAYLSPFVDSGLRYGGGLGWAAEHEIHLVVPLTWDRDFSSNVKELTEVVLMLPDGTALRPGAGRGLRAGRGPAHRHAAPCVRGGPSERAAVSAAGDRESGPCSGPVVRGAGERPRSRPGPGLRGRRRRIGSRSARGAHGITSRWSPR